jgi:hypothetical protein
MPTDKEFDDPNGDYYYELPNEYRPVAKWLYRAKARFQEQSWPATWTLWSRSKKDGSRGHDLWLHCYVTRFMLGIEYDFTEPYAASKSEWHREVGLCIGPFILAFHWWRFPANA